MSNDACPACGNISDIEQFGNADSDLRKCRVCGEIFDPDEVNESV